MTSNTRHDQPIKVTKFQQDLIMSGLNVDIQFHDSGEVYRLDQSTQIGYMFQNVFGCWGFQRLGGVNIVNSIMTHTSDYEAAVEEIYRDLNLWITMNPHAQEG